MFKRSLEIMGSSFRMAVQELWNNKLRTFLSLFGVTIGIFCIIGVLATVNSLQHNIQNEVKSLGSNTIYVDKWNYSGGADYPWWKYINRPVPKYNEVRQIRERTSTAKYVAFCLQATDNVEFSGSLLNNLHIYSVSEDFIFIQPVAIQFGRYISDAEFNYGTSIAIIGYEIAEKLFGSPELAVGKAIKIQGRKIKVSGVIKKQGKQIIGGWNFDQSVILPFQFGRTIYNEEKTDPLILVQGNDEVPSKVLKDQLQSSMRSIHKLSPVMEDDFSLNDINDLGAEIDEAFSGLNIGGAVISGISLIVGLFGVANIMFVTVKERTSQIGLKKAIGAKRNIILAEFLVEAAFLCIIGGAIGLFLVFILAQILSNALDFPIFISFGTMAWTFFICILVGVIAGIIPAMQAAKMDPVVAIRS